MKAEQEEERKKKLNEIDEELELKDVKLELDPEKAGQIELYESIDMEALPTVN